MKHVIRPGSADISDDADVVVPWWSFTKTLIAATALTMVRDGQLALDDALPGESFTLRQLLQHRAGLADYGSVTAYRGAVAAGEDAWPVDQLLHSVSALHAGIEPGHFAYSNVGYLLVRQHLERVSGLGLDALIRRRLLEPSVWSGRASPINAAISPMSGWAMRSPTIRAGSITGWRSGHCAMPQYCCTA